MDMHQDSCLLIRKPEVFYLLQSYIEIPKNIPQQLEQIFDVIFEDRDEHREYRLSKSVAEEILFYKEQDRINGERESGVEAMYSVYSKEVTYLFRLALVIHVIRDIHGVTEVSAGNCRFWLFNL